jgi:hypothetical protein
LSAITLPRGMVLKLLRLAQQGTNSGFITRLPDGELRIRPLQAGSGETEPSWRFAADGETPFAFYRTSAQTVPEAKDIQTWQYVTRLFLSVSVGTKGVLQLRGWQTNEGKADPVELSLAEEAAAQNNGVSRKA